MGKIIHIIHIRFLLRIMNEKKQQSAKVDDVQKLAGIRLPDYTTDQDFKLEVGVVYTGSFRITNAGCIHVRPYKTGSKPGNLAKTVDGDRHAIFLSKHLVRIVMTFDRNQDLEHLKNAFRETIQDCYVDLNDLHL